MLQLFFEKTELSDSVAPVRWCIDADMAREIKLRKSDGYNTFAIIFDVLNKQTHCESRFIASIDELMTYISFSSPGENLIRAAVVYSRMDIRAIKSDLLRKAPGKNYYSREIMFYDGCALSREQIGTELGHFGCRILPESEITGITVSVPKELFAKKPPEWLWKFVNFYFRNKPFEQCDFRKRALYAIPINILLIPFQILLVMIINILAVIFGLLLGLRNIDYKPLLQPLNSAPGDPLSFIDPLDSFFLRKKRKDPKDRWEYAKNRHPAIVPLMPIFPVLMILVLFLVKLTWLKILLLGFGIPILISAVILVLHGLFILIVAGFALCSASISKIYGSDIFASIKKYKLAQEEKFRKLEEKLRMVTCIGTPLVPRVEALPQEAQTVKLRFLKLKRRLCRPYSGN